MKSKWTLLIATGFGTGYAPTAPGTAGTLLGLPLCWLWTRMHWAAAATLGIGFIIGAIAVAGSAEKRLQKKDPGCIVIDEIAGMLVTLIGLPFNAATACVGFLLFRGFDILKPFPIRYVEKKIPGGSGIVLDDVLAGLFANICIRIGIAVWGA